MPDQQNSMPPSSRPVTPSAPTGEIYVMPEKFRTEATKSKGLGLIIALIILFGVIAVSAGYFGYDYYAKSRIPIQTQIKPPVIEVAETALTVPEEMAPTTTAMETTSVATESPVTSTVATSTETTPETALAVTISLDTDSDNLTDVEEIIFGTLPANSDTDNDGYRDGVEVLNGYDPAKPGNAKIADSPFVARFNSDFNSDNFQIYYPKEWQVAQIKEGKQALITANTGEVIKLTVKDNQARQTAMAWYLENHPQVGVSSLRLVDYGDLSGIFSPDGLTAYLTGADKAKLYVFEYLSGRGSEFRYPNIFNFIVKFFELITTPLASEPSAGIASSTATTTN
ncbi:MAG: thrombospondin type 3 repeat-containing protein [Candidatus Buchananbacteria bacterium]